MKLFILILLLFSSNVFSTAIENDVKLTHETVRRINQLLDYYSTDVSPLLSKYLRNENTLFNKIEKDTIHDFWTQLIDHRIVLHALYNTYKDDKAGYKKSLVKYSANLSLQISSAVLSKTLWKNEWARKKLNETNIAQIPRGAFISLENELFANFNKNYMKGKKNELPTLFPVYDLEKDYNQFVAFTDGPQTEQEIALENINTSSLAKLKNYRKFIKSFKNYLIVKKRFFVYKFKNIFYELSLKISTWIGDTKVFKRDPDYYNGTTLIDIKLAQKMEDKVLPGDIMISRTNWFLSNAFLPGFWPHSFIYLGSKDKLSKYFNTDIINKYFVKRCADELLKCSNMISYLQMAKKTKNAYQTYIKKDKYGYANSLIEVTSEGVHFSSIRHTFLNDYLGAMRPTVARLEIAKSVVDAIEMFGLEYDFNFDYHTDDRLVCTELLGKAFAPNSKKGGFELNYDIEKGQYLEFNVGRLSIPSRGLVQKAFDENVKKMRKSEFAFVAFLKGMRKKKTAIFSTESDFYDSRDWKKWSFMRE